MSLSFPEYDGGFPEPGGDWEEVVEGCLAYVKSLLQMYPEMFAAQQSSLLVLSRSGRVQGSFQYHVEEPCHF